MKYIFLSIQNAFGLIHQLTKHFFPYCSAKRKMDQIDAENRSDGENITLFKFLCVYKFLFV